jgi:hypothetical protein
MQSISKRALLALVAVLALSAMAAATASAALPEFSPASGKYTAKLSKVTVTNQEGLYVSCASGTGEGKITGAKTLTAKLTLKECRAQGEGSSCRSAGALTGEIKTEELASTLAYTSKANKEVGIAFNPRYARFATVDCGLFTGAIRSGVVAPVTNLNTHKATYPLELKTTSGYHQVTRGYENEKGEKVFDFPEMDLNGESQFYEAGIETNIELKFIESEEIKA